MASNFAHLFTSIDRYMLCIKGTQKEKNLKFAKLYKKLKFKSIIKAIVFTSLSLNVIKLSQYKLNGDYLRDLKTFPLVNAKFYNDGFFYYSINILIYTVLNNFIVLLLTALLDIRLYLFFKRSVRAKAAIVNRISTVTIRAVADNERKAKSSNKVQKKAKTQDEKFIRLVILNGFFYVLFHIFDLISSIILATLKISLPNEANFLAPDANNLASLNYVYYLNMGDLSYLCSVLYHFPIYFVYDKNFKHSYYSLSN
jgi:hypothetical protein